MLQHHPKQLPSPERFWKTLRALKHSRQQALRLAEKLWVERAKQEEVLAKTTGKTQAFALHHSGKAHREFFHEQLKPLISQLPKHFQALEVGAGMGMLAALLAAYSSGRVLATEMYWTQDSPKGFQHAGTYAHLLTIEPRLRRVLRVTSNAEHLPLFTAFNPRRIGLAIGSAHDLPTPASSFHLVYSLNCLEHIPDVSAYTQEAHRVLKPGGLFFNSTMPLYASPFGHHCQEFYPLAWGHLLWEPEEFAHLILKGSRGKVEWTPGVALTEQHLLEEILPTLNAHTPKQFRQAFRQKPWRVEGFVEHLDNAHQGWKKHLGLTDALSYFTEDDLQTVGLTLLLRKTKRSRWSPALNLPRRWRTLLGRLKRVFVEV